MSTVSRRSFGVAASSAITLDSSEPPSPLPLALLRPLASLFFFFGSRSASIDGSMPGSICRPYFRQVMSRTASCGDVEHSMRSRIAIPSSSPMSPMPPSFQRAIAPASVVDAMPTSAHGPQLMLVAGMPMLRRYAARPSRNAFADA